MLEYVNLYKYLTTLVCMIALLSTKAWNMKIPRKQIKKYLRAVAWR